MRRILVGTVVLLLGVVPALHATEFDPLLSYTGPQLYQRFCASCHGPQAYGDGPVAATLKVMVPDLTRIARRQQGGEFPESGSARSSMGGQCCRHMVCGTCRYGAMSLRHRLRLTSRGGRQRKA